MNLKDNIKKNYPSLLIVGGMLLGTILIYQLSTTPNKPLQNPTNSNLKKQYIVDITTRLSNGMIIGTTSKDVALKSGLKTGSGYDVYYTPMAINMESKTIPDTVLKNLESMSVWDSKTIEVGKNKEWTGESEETMIKIKADAFKITASNDSIATGSVDMTGMILSAFSSNPPLPWITEILTNGDTAVVLQNSKGEVTLQVTSGNMFTNENILYDVHLLAIQNIVFR